MGYRLVAPLVVLCALPAWAQQGVVLRFEEGRVTLRADNAPVRAILAEWAKLGGATIVNGDRVVGPPVTIELTDVPERQALDVVLRNVAGYMLAPRRAGSQAASAFDRILILPTSVAPRNPPPPAAAAAAGRPPVLPRPGVIARPPAAQVDVAGDPLQGDTGGDPEPDAPPQASPPMPGVPRPGLPPLVRRPPVPGAEPPFADGDDAEEPATAPGVAPTPTNPFGVPFGSSTTPGVIAPLPRTTQPQQPPPNRVQ